MGDCVENAWSVLNVTMVEYEKNENQTMHAVDWIKEYVYDEQMTIASNECGYEAAVQEDETGIGSTGIIAIVAVAVFIIVVVLFAFFLLRNRKLKKGVHGWQKDQVPDDEEEIEVEVPISTNM